MRMTTTRGRFSTVVQFKHSTVFQYVSGEM